MRTFIGKDLLLFWRNRRETAMFLLLPIVLVVMLNFVFGSIVRTAESPLHLKIGIVRSGEAAQHTAIAAEVLNGLNGLADATGLTLDELDEEEAQRRLKQGELDGMLRMPGAVGEGGGQTELQLVTSGRGVRAEALGQLLGAYIEDVNYRTAFYLAAGEAPPDVPDMFGGYEVTEHTGTFTMSQYFTLAMGALFSLFLASTVAERTCTEKREYVYHRIRATNARPMYYLMGKTASAFILSVIQFTFIIAVSHLMLGVFAGKSTLFWFGLAAVVAAYALTVAGLSALYTSAALRLRNIDAANGSFLLVTIVLGLFGGGFVPIYLFPDWLQRAGEWTPNGLLVSELAAWIRLEAPSGLILPLVVLAASGAVSFLAGLAFYPKRGEV